MSSVGGMTPRKESGVGMPTTRSLVAQGTFQSSSIPDIPASFGFSRLGLAAGGPPHTPRAGDSPGPSVDGSLPGISS